MEATIYGEDDLVTGVTVVDNRDAEHDIQVEREGDIYSHHQDRYPDHPNDRTDPERKAVMQAREFARYYVYRERGYETLPPNENLDRLTLAAFVVASLSSEQCERYFGDLYRQLKSESTDQGPVVDLPEGLSEENYYLYATELYLGLDRDDLQESLENLDEDHLEIVLETIAEPSGEVDRAFSALGVEPVDRSAGELAEAWIDAVSDVLVQWRLGEQTHRQNGDFERDREPDVGKEVHPHDPGSLAEFQSYLVHHLRCQIRDAYVQTGQRPPTYARVQGPGRDLFTMLYQTLDSLQPYHDPDAAIDWTSALE
ncbi:hypothetical protein NJ7G_0018 [Natrinema sp. J7-2]|nr:hypothetical protein NJ7G_0018 [Natrinema sp. J7-2]